MCLIAKVIRISHAKFHCNRLRTVQDYASLIFWNTVYIFSFGIFAAPMPTRSVSCVTFLIFYHSLFIRYVNCSYN